MLRPRGWLKQLSKGATLNDTLRYVLFVMLCGCGTTTSPSTQNVPFSNGVLLVSLSSCSTLGLSIASHHAVRDDACGRMRGRGGAVCRVRAPGRPSVHQRMEIKFSTGFFLVFGSLRRASVQSIARREIRRKSRALCLGKGTARQPHCGSVT